MLAAGVLSYDSGFCATRLAHGQAGLRPRTRNLDVHQQSQECGKHLFEQQCLTRFAGGAAQRVQ